MLDKNLLNNLLEGLQNDDTMFQEGISKLCLSAMEAKLMQEHITIPKINVRIKGKQSQYYTSMPARYSKSGNRHQIVGKSEQEVKDKFTIEAYETITHTVSQQKKEALTVQDLVKEYLGSLCPSDYSSTGKCKKTTLARYRRMFEQNISHNSFGEKKVINVRRRDCEDFIQYLYGRDLSKSSIKCIKSLVNKAFSYAVVNDLADKNYMTDLPINDSLCSTSRNHNTDIWEDTEIQQLAEASLSCWQQHRYRYSALILVMISLGCRIGELCALTWDDVDFEQNTVLFSKTTIEYTDYDKHRKIHAIDAPKRSSSNRTILLNETAKYWLNEVKKRNEEMGIHSKNVVVAKSGRIPKYDQIMASFKRFCNYSGITYKSPHTCRRTYTTTMIDRGVPLSQVSKDLGHKNSSTTLDSYYKAKKEDDEMIALKNKAIADAFGILPTNLATLGNTPNNVSHQQKTL